MERFKYVKCYKKRGKVSFSHGVTKHFITAFLELQLPLTLSPLHFMRVKTVEKEAALQISSISDISTFSGHGDVGCAC